MDSAVLFLQEVHNIKCGENAGNEEHRCGGKGWRCVWMDMHSDCRMDWSPCFCRLLIDKRAHVEAKTNDGTTPIHCASAHGLGGLFALCVIAVQILSHAVLIQRWRSQSLATSLYLMSLSNKGMQKSIQVMITRERH